MSKETIVSVIRKSTGLMHVDRINKESSVLDQAIRELEAHGKRAVKVTIETADSEYRIQYNKE